MVFLFGMRCIRGLSDCLCFVSKHRLRRGPLQRHGLNTCRAFRFAECMLIRAYTVLLPLALLLLNLVLQAQAVVLKMMWLWKKQARPAAEA
jgi:hypothetical protein